MPRKKSIVKQFEKWKKGEYESKSFENITYDKTEEIVEHLLTEEKLHQLFSAVERVGQAETKVKLALEEFEKLIGKPLNMKTRMKLQSIKRIISELQRDLLDEIQGG